MKSTGYLFLLMVMVARVTIIQSNLLEVGSHILINDMPSQNLKIHNDMIYVGVKNKILSLNKDLELVKFYNTCKSGIQEDICNNKNKVMILNNKANQLIVCGTGLDGVCELLGLPDFKIIKGANESSLSVSVDINSPATGVITRNGNLTIAVTNGPRASGSYIYKESKEFAISKRKLSTLEVWSDMSITMTDEAKDFDTFVVKYKDGFQHKNYTYFVTNQHNYVTGVKKMISKLVRLCEDDTNFKGYVDIEIGCMDNDGSEYNLIQHIMKAETVSGDVWFVGIFSKSDNSNGLPGDSVLCATKLIDVNQVINSTWQNFITCKNETRLNTRAYFKDTRPLSCVKEPVKESEYSCENKYPPYSYNIGVQKLIMTLKDTLESTDVTTAVLTSILDGRDYSSKGNNPVIILGTSTGNLHFYNLKINKEEFTVSRYLDYYLGSDVPVTGIIQEDEDFLYVLSETMLYKLTGTNCSEFGSCQSTMTGNNPLCGWCVLQNKATRRGQCTSGVNHWLSALDGKCPSFTYEPKGVKFGTSVPIVLNVKNVPKQDGDVYKCIFRINSSVLGTVDAIRSDDVITCQSPNVNYHAKARLELSLSGNIIASEPFIFYDCQQFTKCGDCVSTVGVDCKWNSETLVCGSTGIDNKNSCPALSSNIKYIPSDVKENVILTGSNLNATGYNYKCQIDGKCFNAALDGTHLTCQIVEISTNISKSEKPIKVKVGLVANVDCFAMKDIDDEHSSKVIVYDCGLLVNEDCSKCCALNKERYKCNWNNGECQYSSASTRCNDNRGCPKPIIDQLKPSDGPIKGGTVITLTGKHFGHWSNRTINGYKANSAVKVDNISCGFSDNKDDYNVHPGGSNTDYLLPFPTRIVCTVPQITRGFPSNITMLESDVTLKIELSGPKSDPKQFTYKKPTFANIKPVKGIVAGKTRIFITGKHLSIGNKKITVYLTRERQTECTDVETNFDEGSMAITCLTGSVKEAGRYKVYVVMEGNLYTTNLNFTYTANATIDGISPTKGFASGGTRITVNGEGFENVQNKRVVLKFSSYKKETVCTDIKPGVLICTVPAVSEEHKNEIMKLSNKTRKKRSIDDGCISVGVALQLDGLTHDFNIKYCRDPELEEFNDGVLLYGSDDTEIKIKGDYLTLVAAKDDFNVTVGVADCLIMSLEEDEITCLHYHKSEVTQPDVIVTVGNIRKRVGRIQYQIDVNNTFIIAGAAAAGVVFLIGLVVFCICCLYKREIRKIEKKFNDEIKALEMKIIEQEMHTTMSSVKQNLVEQGIPYHTYQQYACNVMFAIDYLLTEPVVSNGKMTDDERFRAKKGLDSLEALILNNFFLISVIGTMEKQKKFLIREKFILAGNLCAILMGRMDYVLGVLRVLLRNLVKESSGKKGQQKALFRRCESITEKLLSNWLSLCLYPHFKNYSGSPLYNMYLVLQKTIEAGPIDAITGDTKYTLSEKKLLKKSSCSTAEENLRFESKTLTLNAVVNDETEVHKCKVLDCDTITQVKCKCLSQIYVHYPASQLNVDPEEIILEWHEGFDGKLKLQDHDSISVQEGKWVRLNTLAHYNVKDDSNVALVVPHALESMQLNDYVNLTGVTMIVGGCYGSIDSSDPVTSPKPCDEELEYWHLVKKEEENTKQGKSAIDILYLNNLFTTKLAIKDHMTSLFDIILNQDKCPPPTKFLLHFMDELGEQSKVDNDTLHAWKSHSYAIRVWAALIKLPSILFDVEIPQYMNDNLDVISQVFIESFSLSSQKFTKDSPSQKTVFNHEINECRERALEFYKNVKEDQQNQEEFRQYLVDVNKLQQTTNFNKVSALHRFYKQLEPYLGDIVKDLATCKETKDLQLDRKLENVMTIMNEENDD